MAISKERKEALVAQYKELIVESKAIFLTEYGGMSVKDLQDLRTKVREADGKYFITKNTLLKLALEQSDVPTSDEMLMGQVATGFAMGEVPSMAKALVNYAKDEDNLKIKGGIMNMKFLSDKEIEALAELPSLDQLRAQIIGLINGPARGIVSTLTGGVRQVVNVVDAYSKSEDAEPEVAA
ncbi:MAG: 50S ribosomal protein L10 [Candidatus Promineifilaceae bacterium]|nr:50S ribosomal protein L10 [Candidatus Promineifilaceae bacterium]